MVLVVGVTRYGLRWAADRVADVMRLNGIGSRHELASVLPVGRTSVYRSFSSSWEGGASSEMIHLISSVFDVPPHTLYQDPRMIEP